MDKRALEILFQTYWSSEGWKAASEQIASEADFAYAKEMGAMFDPISIAHDACLARLRDAAKRTTQRNVTAAFLSSLSSRSLQLRSALSSYHFASIPWHRYATRNGLLPFIIPRCRACNRYSLESRASYRNEDLSVLNFERFKFGGVRHGQLIYCMFDLEQFLKEDAKEPTAEDILIFKRVLRAIEECGADDAPRQLEGRIKGLFPSNKHERDGLIEILSCAGVIRAAHERPIRGIRNDWRAAEHWRGEDGYDRHAVDALFGMYL